MAIRKPIEILPTMKIKVQNEETDIPFQEVTGSIEKVQDIETKHGSKVIMTIADNDKRFNVFVNNHSMENLIAAYGEDDTKWIGQKITTNQEKDKKYNQDMIVLTT